MLARPSRVIVSNPLVPTWKLSIDRGGLLVGPPDSAVNLEWWDAVVAHRPQIG